MNLQMNFVACHQLHQPKSSQSNSKSWQGPTQGHSYVYEILPLWYCTLLITTAPSKAAGISHCTHARQVSHVVLKLSTLVWELGSRAGLQSPHPCTSQGAKWESGALCRLKCLFAWTSATFNSNVFPCSRVFFLFWPSTLTQREEKQSLKFIVKPLCFVPLSWLIPRMKEHISSQAKNTFGKKRKWKISKGLF